MHVFETELNPVSKSKHLADRDRTPIIHVPFFVFSVICTPYKPHLDHLLHYFPSQRTQIYFAISAFYTCVKSSQKSKIVVVVVEGVELELVKKDGFGSYVRPKGAKVEGEHCLIPCRVLECEKEKNEKKKKSCAKQRKQTNISPAFRGIIIPTTIP